jgi:hypothetical protein
MVEELLTISQRLFILDFCYKSCYPEYYTLAQSVKECSIYSISKISVFIILFGFMSGMYGQQVVQDHKIIKMEAFGIPDSRAYRVFICVDTTFTPNEQLYFHASRVLLLWSIPLQ